MDFKDIQEKTLDLQERDVMSRECFNDNIIKNFNKATDRDDRTEQRNIRILEINEEILKINERQTKAFETMATALNTIVGSK